MSEVKVVHDIKLDMERIMPRLNLVSVGELVRREPESASGSLNPWVINLAFARGDPSALVDHLRMKWAEGHRTPTHRAQRRMSIPYVWLL